MYLHSKVCFFYKFSSEAAEIVLSLQKLQFSFAVLFQAGRGFYLKAHVKHVTVITMQKWKYVQYMYRYMEWEILILWFKGSLMSVEDWGLKYS